MKKKKKVKSAKISPSMYELVTDDEGCLGPVYKRHGRKSFVRRRLRPYLNAYGYVDPMADLSDVYVDAVESKIPIDNCINFISLLTQFCVKVFF